MVALVLFATMLTNVSEEQKRCGELERRYQMKVGIYEELIARAKNQDFNFDVEKEMMLVNKLFSRSTRSKKVEIEQEAALIREKSSKVNLDQEKVLNSMNSKGAEESLEDLFKDIIKDLDGPEHHNEMEDRSLQRLPREPSEDIITNKEWLEHEAKVAQERAGFKPSTEKHLIVDNPGEYNMAAEDTKVKRFL